MPGIVEVTVYKTADGKTHNSLLDAKLHQNNLDLIEILINDPDSIVTRESAFRFVNLLSSYNDEIDTWSRNIVNAISEDAQK